MACVFEYKGKRYSQDELAKELENMHPSEAYKYIDSIQNIPNAPFKTQWADLALKRAITQAVKEGKDAISWTPGEAQAARYDLSKQIKELRVSKTNNNPYELTAIDHNGRAHEMTAINEKELSGQIGKELAEKIIKNQNSHQKYEGIDLKIGGEGMKSFYDKMLVDKANRLVKKYGGKVEYENLPTAKGERVPIIRITPEMREKIGKDGFPLFTAPVYIPVDYDPWLKDNKKKHKLVPIDYNPFTNPRAL